MAHVLLPMLLSKCSRAPCRAEGVMIRFALVILIVMTSSSAHADSRCLNLFQSENQQVEDLGAPRPSAKIIGIQSNDAGETFFIIQRLLEETYWASNFSKHGYDLQGNPLNPFNVLGIPLARVLGFTMVSHRKILAPTPETLNRRIAAFNKFLIERRIAPIEIGFYLQLAATLDSFLDGWSTAARLPVFAKFSDVAAFDRGAAYDHHTIHDISYHYPGVLLPPQVVRLLQVRAEMTKEWGEFYQGFLLRWHKVRSVGAIDATSTSANVPTNRSVDSDGLSRYAAQFFSSWKFRNKASSENRMLVHFLGRSPLQLFVRQLRWPHPLSNPEDLLDPNFIELNDAINLFEKTARARHPDWDQPLSSFGFDSLNGMVDLYNSRAEELRSAASDFLISQQATEAARPTSPGF